jgi:hypothetical protein
MRNSFAPSGVSYCSPASRSSTASTHISRNMFRISSLSPYLVKISEYRVILPDGRLRWMVGRGHVEFNADGQPARMVGAYEATCAAHARVMAKMKVQAVADLVRLAERCGNPNRLGD